MRVIQYRRRRPFAAVPSITASTSPTPAAAAAAEMPAKGAVTRTDRLLTSQLPDGIMIMNTMAASQERPSRPYRRRRLSAWRHTDFRRPHARRLQTRQTRELTESQPDVIVPVDHSTELSRS